MMSSLRARWRRFRPARIEEGRLAFVAMQEDGTPTTAAWAPFSSAQLFGGRNWTLSLIRRQPLVSGPPAKPTADRQLVEDALDLLEGDYKDPRAAAALLKNALRS